jgi:hypothetical protein
MKTTLMIDDGVMRRLKAEAAKRGTTISELVEAALRRFLDRKLEDPGSLAPLPVFSGGAILMDFEDRSTLNDLLSTDRDHVLYDRSIRQDQEVESS